MCCELNLAHASASQPERALQYTFRVQERERQRETERGGGGGGMLGAVKGVFLFFVFLVVVVFKKKIR